MARIISRQHNMRLSYRATFVSVSLLVALVSIGSSSSRASEEACGAVPPSNYLRSMTMTPSHDQSNAAEQMVSRLVDLPAVISVSQIGDEPRITVERTTSAEQMDAIADHLSNSLRGTVKRSCLTLSEIEQSATALRQVNLDVKSFLAFGYDPMIDRFVVLSNLPDSVVGRTLEKTNSDTSPVIISVSDGQFELSSGSRTADTTPHWAGAQIAATNGSICTSGFTVAIGSILYSITAGHCPNSTYVSGSNSFSTNYLRASNYPATDVARLGGSSYAGRTYSSSNSTSNKPISGDADPQNGFTYCQYGSQSLRRCFTQTASGQTVCFSDGCRQNLSQANSTSQSSWAIPGDSGGPIAKENSNDVGARGLVVGRGTLIFDGTTYYYIYYHTASTIEKALGASIKVG